MHPASRALLVGLGGFVGANVRYFLSLALAPRLGGPWPTLAINLVGSLLLGVLIGATRSDAARLFLGVGALGGFTTFSTFSLEIFGLVEGRDMGRAVAYAAASVLGGVFLAGIGMAAGRAWSASPA